MSGDHSSSALQIRQGSRIRSWLDSLGVYRHPKVLALLFLGFSAGLPIALVYGTLSAWLRQEGISRTEIGFLSWVTITYTFKFAWSPFIDRFRLPILHRILGQRRSWMLLAQLGIVAGLFGMSITDPKTDTITLALLALSVAFFSATQDIALDAYRIEAGTPELQGAMAGAYQLGYNVASRLIAGAAALYLASSIDWPAAYKIMAAFGLVGIIATFIVREPVAAANSAFNEQERRVLNFAAGLGRMPQWLREFLVWIYGGVVCPFVDFFRRNGWVAVVILLFIGTFRISDIVLGIMANPFYIDIGFTTAQIADITKVFGFVLTIVGALLGGVFVFRFGAARLLALCVLLTGGTNLLFAWMAAMGKPDIWALTLTISADNFASGFAGSVFIAYLSGLTSTAYTATQYALFSSLMLTLGKILGGFSGLFIDRVQAAANEGAQWAGLIAAYVATPDQFSGYFAFFIYTFVIGLPAFLLSFVMVWIDRRRQAEN